MLTHLQLKNFKIWKSTGPIRLAPVTLLLGTNSSGKSSLIQSLLLIRQTVKGGDANLDLNLGNPDESDSVTLGRFKDVLCRHGSSNRMGIEFRWSPTGSASDSAIFNAEYAEGSHHAATLTNLRIGLGDQGFLVTRQRPGMYSLFLSSDSRSRGNSPDFRPERSFNFSQKTLAQLNDKDARELRDAGNNLAHEMARIIYLGPVRHLAQRDYLWNGRFPSSIGDDGGKAVDALIASGIEAQHALKKNLPMPGEAMLFNQTCHWLKRMDVAENLSVRALSGGPRHELLVHTEHDISNLKDVGVGVSQVLPVIVAALFARPGHIVLLEEPESHLHPLAQSVLAELFATVSREHRVQFIVESHSEHLFRRMQTLIARQSISHHECAMYFVEREGKQANMRHLTIDEMGRIANWPPQFFGDSLGETREQARLMFERQQQARRS